MALPTWAEIQALTEPFTRARLSALIAVANWVDGYGALNAADAGGFRRMEFWDYQTTDEKPPVDDWRPKIADLPCLSVEPMATELAWEANTLTRAQYPLEFRIYTPRHRPWQGERLMRRVVTALFQSKETGETVAYVKTVTGQYPKYAGTISNGKVRLAANGGHARLWIVPMSLTVNFTPTSSAYASNADATPS